MLQNRHVEVVGWKQIDYARGLTETYTRLCMGASSGHHKEPGALSLSPEARSLSPGTNGLHTAATVDVCIGVEAVRAPHGGRSVGTIDAHQAQLPTRTVWNPHEVQHLPSLNI